MTDQSSKEKHDHEKLKFPEEFLWGAATSAHQVEGNNVNSDWWAWEQTLPEDKRSGAAANQYELYEQDFDLAKSLNQNAHRLSIEWARIEPTEGQFDAEAIDHYKKVLKALKDRGFTVMLTLWHWTLPEWLAKKGGWENSKTIKYYARYIEKIVPEIKDYVDLWITLNEPTIYAWGAYLVGYWPPQKKNFWSSTKVMWNLARAHKRAYKILHKHGVGKTVGIAHNVQTYHAFHKHSIIEQISVTIGDIVTNHLFYFLTGMKTHDFLGINYYFHHRIRRGDSLIPKIEEVRNLSFDVSDLGWEIFPEGMFDALTDLKDHRPIYITECGIASTNDDRRNRFLILYLQEVFRSIQAGVNVKGFFYWSMIDNFEWAEGFGPRFGLIEVDYKTQKRTPRPSAYVYSEIAKENGIVHRLLRFIGHTIRADEVLCSLHDAPKAFCEHLN